MVKQALLVLYMENQLEQEHRLVEEAKQSPERFALLYDRYVEQIYRYVRRRVNEDATAEDLVSQTFFDALNHLQSYQFRGFPFSSWLYKIAHNNVLKWYRENSKYNKVDLEDVKEILGEDILEENLDVNLEKDELKKALERMDYEERELIRLKYFEEVSNIEMGEIMGITPNNIGVKLFRALRKLKSLLEEENLNYE